MKTTLPGVISTNVIWDIKNEKEKRKGEKCI
jgi:hypothetical protein